MQDMRKMSERNKMGALNEGVAETSKGHQRKNP